MTALARRCNSTLRVYSALLRVRRRGWTALVVFALLCSATLLGSTDAAAQCVSCGNPAFASGDNDLSRTMVTAGSVSQFQVRAGLGYGFMTSDSYLKGTHLEPNYDNFSMIMHLWNLNASVETPWGTSIAAVMPWGYLRNKRNFGGGIDRGFGDFELRARQQINALWGGKGPKVVLSAGLVAPTGMYVERETTDTTVFDDTGLGGGFGGGGWGDEPEPDAVATNDSDRYLSIGRGAWWLTADLEVFGSINSRFGYYAALNSRMPLTYSPDQFGWGNEIRNTVGVNSVVVAGWLNASLMGEYQWRGRSTEVLKGEREEFLNGGGNYITVMPTLQVVLGKNLGLSVSGRVPVYQDVVGVQVVANSSVWVTLSGHFGIPFGAAPAAGNIVKKTPAGSDRASMFVKNKATAQSLAAAKNTTKVGERPKIPEIVALLVPGKTTVVDYWATWCKPCTKLDKEVHAFLATNPKGVVFKKFDATNWEKPDWLKYLPDAPTLPVLDVYDGEGRLVARLSGAAAFEFQKHLPKQAPVEATPAAAAAAPVSSK